MFDWSSCSIKTGHSQNWAPIRASPLAPIPMSTTTLPSPTFSRALFLKSHSVAGSSKSRRKPNKNIERAIQAIRQRNGKKYIYIYICCLKQKKKQTTIRRSRRSISAGEADPPISVSIARSWRSWRRPGAGRQRGSAEPERQRSHELGVCCLEGGPCWMVLKGNHQGNGFLSFLVLRGGVPQKRETPHVSHQ